MTKKLLTLALIVSSAWLQSCGKSPDLPAPSVVGTWKLITEEDFNCPTSTDNKVYTCGSYAYCATITFNSSKTFRAVRTWDNYDLGSGTYVFSGGSLALSYTGNVGSDVSQATVSGNTLITIRAKTNACSLRDTYQKQ